MTHSAADVKRVHVLGAGRMGQGIALAFAGLNVTLIDVKERVREARAAFATAALGEIARQLQALVEFGRLDASEADEALARIEVLDRAGAEASLAGCEVVFEAVPEVMTAKEAAFVWLCAHVGEAATIASTTSTFLVTDLQKVVTHPRRLVNAHWLNPAHLMPLVEISRSSITDEAVIARLKDLLRRAGKVSVECAPSAGYIVPRLQALVMNEAARMVEEGVASAHDIDTAVRTGFGLRFSILGLLEFVDWGGCDILHYASHYLAKEIGQRFEPAGIVTRHMEEGRDGIRDGKGFLYGQTLMLVKIYCSDGVTGIGEGTTIAGMAYGPESPEAMKLAIDAYFAPAMIGQDAARIQALMAHLGKLVKVNHFAKCTLETALLDAQGKRLGVPVSELLGGRRRERLPVAWTLASGDTAKDIAEAEAMLEVRRHKIFKLKIGTKELKTDIKHVAEIKKAMGDRAAVRADVNMAWSETQAAWTIPALAEAGCELVEQPVSSPAALARLMRRFPVALMADEILQGPESAFEIAKNEGADVFSIKIEQSGGLFAAQRVATIADAAGIELYGGTMLEGAFSTVASAHLFASFANLQWGTELFGPLLITEEILTKPLDYSDFELTVPNGPGLGIELDEAKVKRFTRDGLMKVTK